LPSLLAGSLFLAGLLQNALENALMHSAQCRELMFQNLEGLAVVTALLRKSLSAVTLPQASQAISALTKS
jgi:hypothetical protein